MFLDRFGQANKFWKKSWNKFWDIQILVLLRSSRGRPINVLGTSRVKHPGTFLERQIRTSPRRLIETSQRCQIRTSPGWSNRIFRGGPGDVGGGRPRDVLGTNICRQGKLSIWRGALGIFDIDAQLNYIKIKWIQRLLNPTNALWKDLMLYWN